MGDYLDVEEVFVVGNGDCNGGYDEVVDEELTDGRVREAGDLHCRIFGLFYFDGG